MQWGEARGFHFWSTGFAWGTLETRDTAKGLSIKFDVLGGRLFLKTLEIAKAGMLTVDRELKAGESVEKTIG